MYAIEHGDRDQGAVPLGDEHVDVIEGETLCFVVRALAAKEDVERLGHSGGTVPRGFPPTKR